MLSTEFFLTSLVVVLIPGTGVIYTISTGLFNGYRSSIAAAAGCTAGILPHIAAGIIGLSAILHMSAIAFQVIKFAGVVYLLYLAWLMWRENGTLAFEDSGQKTGFFQIALRGVMINILNPKLTMFFLAFLPQFIVSEGTLPPLFQMIILSGVFMGMTLFVFLIYGLSAHYVRASVVNSPKRILWIQRSFAFIFASLGLKLALTEQ